MLTWSDLQLKYQDITNDDATANLTFGKASMNYGYQQLVRSGNYSFPEVVVPITSVGSTYNYALSPKVGKVKSVVYIDDSDNEYIVKEIMSQKEWNYRSANDTGEAAQPTHFFQFGRELWLHPTPSEDDETVNVTCLRNVPQFDTDDYTTGTATFTNADATVTGSGTTYTVGMEGRFILGGDGYFYEILDFTSTILLELTVPYEGSTEASVTTKIGQVPIIPEQWQDGIWQYAVGMYEAQMGNDDRSTFFLTLYEKTKADISEDSKNKTTQQVFRDSDVDDEPRSVNDYPRGPL